MLIKGCTIFRSTSRRQLMRRRLALFGTACTGAFVGLLFLDKIRPNGAFSCANVCASYSSDAYKRLERNETRGLLQQKHIRGFDVNFLPSNSPMEDRFVIGGSRLLNSAVFAVIDGHQTYHCAEHVQNNLLTYLAASMRPHVKQQPKAGEWWETVVGMTLKPNSSSAEASDGGGPALSMTAVAMEQCVRDAFLSLDKDISTTALNLAKELKMGRPLTEKTRQGIMEALAGACATAALVHNRDVYVATVGDCRAVLGRMSADGSWTALPLSVDQNADNPSEVGRVNKAHPREQYAIFNKRILGILMPFRAFGDVGLKWQKEDLSQLVQIPSSYLSPPYVTAEPVVTSYPLQKEDRFIIIASDGLWERLDNDKAVKVVAECIERSRKKHNNLYGKEDRDGCCCAQNAATRLLWASLGGTEDAVQRLLNVSPDYSRLVRDDITVVVIHLEDL